MAAILAMVAADAAPYQQQLVHFQSRLTLVIDAWRVFHMTPVILLAI